MDDHRVCFERWFKEPISQLHNNSDAGFIIVITSLTLLERYLREKSGTYEKSKLNDMFHEEFTNIFPTINKKNLSKIFWKVCRHGLMHQCTFKTKTKSSKTICEIGLHESADEITYSNTGTGYIFMISPKKFSDRIINLIEKDFATFKGKGSPNHPLPSINSGFTSGYSGYSGYSQS